MISVKLILIYGDFTDFAQLHAFDIFRGWLPSIWLHYKTYRINILHQIKHTNLREIRKKNTLACTIIIKWSTMGWCYVAGQRCKYIVSTFQSVLLLLYHSNLPTIITFFNDAVFLTARLLLPHNNNCTNKDEASGSKSTKNSFRIKEK